MNSTDVDYDFPEVDSHGIYESEDHGDYDPAIEESWRSEEAS